jgi:hypothetical protein
LYIRISFEWDAGVQVRARLVGPQRGQTMMPMRMRRKPRYLEKVEIHCRTATAEHIMPAPAWRCRK